MSPLCLWLSFCLGPFVFVIIGQNGKNIRENNGRKTANTECLFTDATLSGVAVSIADTCEYYEYKLERRLLARERVVCLEVPRASKLSVLSTSTDKTRHADIHSGRTGFKK